EKLTIDARVDQFWGFGDNTTDLHLSMDLPLYPKRVSLSVWMTALEYYQTTIDVRNERLARTEKPCGWAVGDVYVKTSVQLLRDRPKAPDIVVSAVLKTASGSPLDAVRYYDTPGYYFDATVGKTFSFKPEHLVKSVSVSAMVGFLCWQDMQARQDDACLYGIKVGTRVGRWDFSIDWSGYAGWIGNGDCPMVIRAQARSEISQGHCLYIGGLVGLLDYPYFNTNIGYQFSIPLSFRKKKTE
ncbi:MAG: hypothetical protein HUK15_05700, partial [Bacteroidales bacterium]|nr:hypothetical protein [Bacteroidales bacterium]